MPASPALRSPTTYSVLCMHVHACMNINKNVSLRWVLLVHAFDPNIQEVRQVDLCEFEDNQDYTEKPYLKISSSYLQKAFSLLFINPCFLFYPHPNPRHHFLPLWTNLHFQLYNNFNSSTYPWCYVREQSNSWVDLPHSMYVSGFSNFFSSLT